MSSMFDGDGRHKVKPSNVPEGTRAIAVTKAQARHLIKTFEKYGFSQHSANGQMVWIIVQHCKENDIDLRVEHFTDGGYICTRMSLKA